MKKRFLIIPAVLCASILGSCNAGKAPLTGVAKILDDNKAMSVEDLAKLAKEEKGGFTVYSTSSKTGKNITKFAQKYGLKELENLNQLNNLKVNSIQLLTN